MMLQQNSFPPAPVTQGGGGNMPPFNEEMFRKLLPRLDNGMVEQAVRQARMSGIPEQVIQQGMDILKRFK